MQAHLCRIARLETPKPGKISVRFVDLDDNLKLFFDLDAGNDIFQRLDEKGPVLLDRVNNHGWITYPAMPEVEAAQKAEDKRQYKYKVISVFMSLAIAAFSFLRLLFQLSLLELPPSILGTLLQIVCANCTTEATIS